MGALDKEDLDEPFVQELLRGSRFRLEGANLRDADFEGANLGVMDLSGADLTEADFSLADAHSTRFDRSQLVGADFTRANCRGAVFSGSNLTDAELGGADLSLADLSRANLSKSRLGHANLRMARVAGAEFEGGHVGGTSFNDVDLSTVKGLETVVHDGPSTIGIDTIYKSHGKISEVFLRGCGVPDEFIAYIGSMVGRPIEFYSCFISYSSRDQEFAERLHADLQAKGVRCWFAPHDIKGGRKIHEQIDDAIRLHDRLLLILSEHSMSSEWVNTEIAKARKREVKEGKRVLFPVRLVGFERLRDWECFDGDTGKDSSREIREYFIPDFSNWKDHDSYQKAFGRLVADLKAEASK